MVQQQSPEGQYRYQYQEVMVQNIGQEIVFAEHHNVTVTLTFSCYSSLYYSCHN